MIEKKLHYIKKLIAEGEHQQLDFKFEISDSKKIAKTLVAFSNTDGGKLLIGVKDNGRIAGIRSEEEYYMVETAAYLYCKPKIEFQIQKWSVDGKAVLEVTIPQGEKLPYFAKDENDKWLAYVRIHDENILANNIHLKVWKKQNQKRGIFLEFSDKEKLLLKYLETNESITLSKFCRVAMITKKTAEYILANLISLGVVKMSYTDKHFVYQNSKYALEDLKWNE